MGGELTNRIIQDLNNAADGKSKYKMTYYSGHDLTLLEVMGTLGVPLEEAPSYASNLQFELSKMAILTKLNLDMMVSMLNYQLLMRMTVVHLML